MRTLTKLFAIFLCAFVPAAFADSALFFHSQQGDYIGGGQTVTTRPSEGYTVALRQNYGNPGLPTYLEIGFGTWNLSLAAPANQTLQVGSYLNALRAPFSQSAAGVDFYGNGRGCNTIKGKFDVLELTLDAAGTVTTLAVDFEQHCGGALPALFGQLRYNSSIAINTAIRWPTPFEFQPLTNLSPNTQVTSATATIQAITVPLSVSISGGEYSIDGGAFTANPSSVIAGQTIKVRTTSALLPNTLKTAVVTVGEFQAPFKVATQAGTVPQPNGQPLLVIKGATVDATGSYITRVLSPATLCDGLLFKDNSSASSIVNFQSCGNNGNGSWQGRFSGPDDQPLIPGTYLRAAAFPAAGVARAVIGADASTACFNPYDALSTMIVREAEYAVDGTPTKLALDLVQYCALPDTGVFFSFLRFNSTLPIDYSIRLPALFSFAPIKGAVPSSIVNSDEVTIAGINVPVGISITGGEYSINGGAYSGVPGTVSSGQRVRVRVTMPAQNNAAKTATLTIGERSATFLAGTAPTAYPQPNGTSLAVVLTANPSTKALDQFVMSEATGVEFKFNQSFIVNAATIPNGAKTWSMEARGPNNALLSVGEYVVPGGQVSGSPMLSTSGYTDLAPGCNGSFNSSGKFRVHEVEYSNSGTLLRLAMDFVQNCELYYGGPPAVFGFIRINSSVPIDYSITQPAPFAFATVTGATSGAWVESQPQAIYGFNRVIGMSVVGGEISVDGGPYSANPGSLNNAVTVRVRVLAPSVANALAKATINIGDSSATFAVATAPGANPPINGAPLIVVRSRAGDYLGQGQSYVLSPATLSTFVVRNGSNNELTIETNLQGQTQWSFSMLAPYGARLSAGRYQGAVWNATPSSGLARLWVQRGFGCSPSTGEFTVREVTYSGSDITAIAVDLVHLCGGSTAPIYAYIRYNSNIPIPREATRITNDLTGDNKSDLIFTDSSGAVNVMLLNGLTPTVQANLLGANSGWTVTHVADLDGDGNADVIIRNTDGRAAALLVRAVENPVATGIGTTTSGTRVVYVPLLDAGSGWSVTHTGDFNADGSADLLIANPDGRVAFLMMNGGAVSTYTLLTNVGSGYSVAMTGDFNGDGRADIVLKNTNGSAAVVLMDGPIVTSASLLLTPGSPWTPTFAGDLNGDGKSDIVIKSADGTVVLLLMNGTAVSSAAYLLTAGTPYSVTHVGDFNGDLKSDFILRHTDGSYAVILMDGTTVTGFNTILAKGSGATVSQIGDYNGDGKSDILVRTSDGSALMLLMNGTATSSAGIVWGAGTRVVVP